MLIMRCRKPRPLIGPASFLITFNCIQIIRIILMTQLTAVTDTRDGNGTKGLIQKP